MIDTKAYRAEELPEDAQVGRWRVRPRGVGEWVWSIGPVLAEGEKALDHPRFCAFMRDEPSRPSLFVRAWEEPPWTEPAKLENWRFVRWHDEYVPQMFVEGRLR